MGSLMLSKRMALVGGPLGHLTLPGITLALISGFDVSLGAFLFVALGILFIWLLEMRTKLPMEAITAIIFASGVAAAFLFLPEEKTVPALIGDVSQVSVEAVAAAVILSLLVFLATKKIFSGMVLASISEDLAIVSGTDTRKLNFIYLACIAVVVSLGVRIVGGLMTAAVVAIPACTSRNLSRNLFQYSYIAMVLGGIGCVLGVVSAALTGTASGPLIVIVDTLLFVVSLTSKRTGT